MMCYTVRPEQVGVPLAGFLGARFRYHTMEGWLRRIAEGAVLVNDKNALPDYTLKTNDVINYLGSDVPEPHVDKTITVLYEDRDIILVNKTGNLPVHPVGKYFKNTLWAVLKEKCGVAAPIIITRLDRETSGVTLIAKNPSAGAACRRQFNSRSVSKKYIVLTEGILPEPVHARGYIVSDDGSVIRIKQKFEPSGDLQPEPGRESEWAYTEFIPRGLHGEAGLSEVVPHTGRTHQIRASLLSLGYPVVGDKMYGLDERIFLRFLEGALTSEDISKLRLKRQALHASELCFSHPSDGRTMTITAPLPSDIRGLLN